MRTVESAIGDEISQTAAIAILQARAGHQVEMRHNDTAVPVVGQDDVGSVVRRWSQIRSVQQRAAARASRCDVRATGKPYVFKDVEGWTCHIYTHCRTCRDVGIDVLAEEVEFAEAIVAATSSGANA